MEKFFALFGKFVLIVALLGAVSYGGYTFGKRTPATQPSPGAASTTAAPQPEADRPLAETPIPKSSKIVTAGLDASSGLSFTKYQITVPEGWTPNHVTTNEGTWVDTLVLTKGNAQLKIFQAATGGALCLYPKDADFEGPNSRYDTYVDITTADSIELRRSSSGAAPKNFTMCQKSTENYGQPTVFGHMSITNVLNEATLSEVDAMITSLKKL